MNLLTFIFLVYKTIIPIVYLPILFVRLFKKHQQAPPVEDKLLLLPASELAECIRKKQITSVEVIQAYINRITEVNPIINAIIDNRFQDALEDAQKADDLIRSSTEEEIKQKYPLLGVPLTVKGSIAVKGMKHTGGRADRDVIAIEDGAPVGHARRAGAIPLLTSNIPELCMNWETTNKLVGTTSNPYDTRRTPGGSSGGEASLLGCGASLIGIGSDVAGSLRLPAHCCGVWGHKPSPHAVSCVGHYPNSKNEDEWNQVFTLGPMARYAKDLKLTLDIICEDKMRDVMRLNDPVDVKKVRVFYMEGVQSWLIEKTGEDVLRAIRTVVSHFDTKCDTRAKEIAPALMDYCTELSYFRLLNVNDVENIFNSTGDGSYAELRKYIEGKSKHTIECILYGVIRQHVHLIPSKAMNRTYNLLEKLRSDLIQLLGDDGVLILPTIPTEATYKGDALRKMLNNGYLSIFNPLGFPVTHCPVTFSTNGLPVGVQVAAAPNMDRLTLAVAEEIEKRFGGWRFRQNLL